MADNNQNILPSVQDFTKPIDEQEAPKPLPEGEYVAEVTASEFRLSGSGKRCLYLTLNVPASRYPHDYVGPEGGVSVKNVVVAEDNDWSRFRLKEVFDALGARLPKSRVDAQDLLGRSAIIEVNHREFNGSTFPSVKTMKKVA